MAAANTGHEPSDAVLLERARDDPESEAARESAERYEKRLRDLDAHVEESMNRARDDAGGMAMAMFTAAFDMGLVTGAAAFGFVAEAFGYPAMFVSAACVVGAGTAAFYALDPAFRKGGPPGPAA